MPIPSIGMPARRPTSMHTPASVIGMPSRRVSTCGSGEFARVVVLSGVAGQPLLDEQPVQQAVDVVDALGQPVQLVQPALLVQGGVGTGGQRQGRAIQRAASARTRLS
jgi:hypothetical protein